MQPYIVELTVRDRTTHAILTVTDSRHLRMKEAEARADELTAAWATRYGFTNIRKTGIFRTIGTDAGLSVAQVSIRF